jgi:hypothetical protein
MQLGEYSSLAIYRLELPFGINPDRYGLNTSKGY